MSSKTAAVRRRRLLIAAAVTLAVPAVGRAADTVYTFTGAAGSPNWDAATAGLNNGPAIYNWNVGSSATSGYPNSATSDAVIPGGFGVSLDLPITVGNFNLGSGSSLTIQGGETFTVAGPAMVDNGTVTVNTQTGSVSAFNFSGNTVLSGTGNILLNQNGNRAILETATGATLTQNAGHLIHGFGDLYLTLANKGTVNADVSGQGLYFHAGMVTNTALMTATAGGTLQFDSNAVINNAGGQINNSGGTVVFNNATVTGGTLFTASGSGGFQAVNAVTLGTGVTLVAGSGLIVEGGATLNVSGGTLVDNGTITVNTQTGSVSALNFSSNTTVSGTGNIALNQSSSRALLLTAAGATLTQGAGHTLHGFGDATVSLVNQGTVNADVSGGFLAFHTSTIANTALMTATGGGILQFDTSSTVNNSGGTISNNGGRVVLDNATVNGGTLTSTTGSSAVESYDATTLSGVTLSAGSGLIVEHDATTTIAGGSLVNNGTITVNTQTGAVSTLNFSSNTTVSGTGNIALNQSSSRALLLTAAGATLTEGSGQLLHGFGDATVRLVNQGTVNADVSGGFLTFHTSTVTNTALMTATGGGILQFDTNSVVNNGGGTISVNGGEVRLLNTAVTGGTLASTAGSNAVEAYDGTALNAVTLSTGSGLVVEPNSAVTVGGTLVNNGTITVNLQTGATSTLNFSTNTVETGTGNINLNQSSGRANLVTPAGVTLNQSSGNLIHGFGDVTATLFNKGTVNADVSGGTLDFHGPAITNQNLMTATGGGLLQFDGGVAVNNAGGQINNSGGRVLFYGSTTTGGTLVTTAGSSAIEAYDGAVFSNVTLSAGSGLVVEAGATVTVPGGSTLTDNGTVTVNLNTGSTSTLAFNGTGGTLAGSGTLVLTQTAGRSNLETTGAAGVLTQAAGHTIAGFGDVQANLVNNGTVNANVGGVGINLEASPANASTGVVNNSLIEATGTGFVNVNGITLTQSPTAILLATNGSQINIDGSTVVGGLLQTTGTTGVINVNTGTFANNVNVSTGSAVLVTPGNVLTVNAPALTDNGTITVNQNTGSQSQIAFAGGAVALNGSGDIVLTQYANRAFITTAAGTTVTQAAAHTISGFGDVYAALVNNGTVNANYGGQAITLNSSLNGSTGVTNNNLIEATGGGSVNINNITVTQSTAGLLTAAANSTVNLNGATVSGGTVSSAGSAAGGTVQIDNGNPTTYTGGLTVATGTYTVVQGGSTLNLTGPAAITDNGTTYVNTQSGAQSIVNLTNSVTLAGTGNLILDQSSNRALISAAAGATLTQAATHTISGFGDVYAALVNNGTVNANVSGGAITLNTSFNGSTGVTNNNLIEATGGGSVNVNGITLTQSTAGLLTAAAGSTVNLAGATVSGGTVSSAGSAAGGTVQIDNGNPTTYTGGLTVAAGTYTVVQGGSTLNLTGPAAITDNGTTLVNTATGAQSFLNVSSNVTLNGTGDLILTQNSNRAQITAATGATLTQGVGHTISGFGDVYAPIVNNGTIRADVSGQSLNLNAAVTNNGLFYATGGGQLYVPAGILSNLSATTLTGGTYQSDTGGYLNLPNTFVTNAAAVILGGGYNFPAVAPLQTNTGTFTLQTNAAFTTAGNLTTSGTLNIGGPAGAASTVVSSLAVNGTLTQTAGKTEVDGTLTVAGQTVVTGGTLTFGANTTPSGVLTRTLPNGLTLGGTGTVYLAAAASRANRTLLVLPSLTFGGTNAAMPSGRLDVGQNDAVISNLTFGAAFLAGASGYNAGAFNNSGITSSAALADPRRLTAVGIVLNNDGSGNRLYGSATAGGLFDGYNPAATDVLVKYTYFGDANLDGKVDGPDYARIDAGFLSNGSLHGWYNGDFNYDGKVDASRLHADRQRVQRAVGRPVQQCRDGRPGGDRRGGGRRSGGRRHGGRPRAGDPGAARDGSRPSPGRPPAADGLTRPAVRPPPSPAAASPPAAAASPPRVVPRHLGRVVGQVPLLQPPDADQVVDADERPVAEPVLGRPGVPGRVLDRRLVDRPAAHLHQRREVPVRPPEQLEPLHRARAVDLEAAGRVLHRLLRDPVADAVRLPALPPPELGVLPVLPPAGDHVDAVLVEHRDQPGDLLRVVLQVGVDGRDHLAVGRREPGLERRRLPAVLRHPQHPQPRVPPHPRLEQPRRPVRAPVVNEQHLERPAQRRQRRVDPAEQNVDVLLLVVTGDHQRQVGVCVHAAGTIPHRPPTGTGWHRPTHLLCFDGRPDDDHLRVRPVGRPDRGTVGGVHALRARQRGLHLASQDRRPARRPRHPVRDLRRHGPVRPRLPPVHRGRRPARHPRRPEASPRRPRRPRLRPPIQGQQAAPRRRHQGPPRVPRRRPVPRRRQAQARRLPRPGRCLGRDRRLPLPEPAHPRLPQARQRHDRRRHPPQGLRRRRRADPPPAPARRLRRRPAALRPRQVRRTLDRRPTGRPGA